MTKRLKYFTTRPIIVRKNVTGIISEIREDKGEIYGTGADSLVKRLNQLFHMSVKLDFSK